MRWKYGARYQRARQAKTGVWILLCRAQKRIHTEISRKGIYLQGKHYRDNSEEVVKQVNVVVQEGEELPVPGRN